MKRKLSLLSAVLVLALSGRIPAAAAPEDDFSAARKLWEQNSKDYQLQASAEKNAAEQEKRPSKHPQMYEDMCKYYLEQIGRKLGVLPYVHIVTRAQLLNRADYASLADFKVEDIEKDLREVWKMVYKQDKTKDYLALYRRYMAEKKYADAVRIAEECNKEYGWAWEARTWEDWIITAMSHDAQFADRMTALIVQFCDKRRQELGAHEYLLRYLGYLQAPASQKAAAHVVDACVASYKDCDWEPDFLVKAMGIHGGAMARQEKAVPPAPDPAKRLFDLCTRIFQRCPYDPAASKAALDFFKATGGEATPLGEAVSRLTASYLAKCKKTPEWLDFWKASAGSANAGKPEWTALAEEAKLEEDAVVAREKGLKDALATPATDRPAYLQALLKFADENPDTEQAQKAIAALTKKLSGNDWAVDVKDAIPPASKTIKAAFPNGPVFKSVQLQALADYSLPDAAEIFAELLNSASAPLQNEWYHFKNHHRSISRGGYDLEAFKKWAARYKGSYLLPRELENLCRQACYAQRPDDACRACGAMTDKRYAHSLTVSDQFTSNIGGWIQYTVKTETKSTDNNAFKGSDRVAKSYRDQGVQQANMIDKEQKDNINLGRLYYEARPWAELLPFMSWKSMTGTEVLRTGNYKNSFYYWYGGAYKKDK